MATETTFDGLMSEGKATWEGDGHMLQQLRSVVVQFCPDFELLPGTKQTPPAAPVGSIQD